MRLQNSKLILSPLQDSLEIWLQHLLHFWHPQHLKQSQPVGYLIFFRSEKTLAKQYLHGYLWNLSMTSLDWRWNSKNIQSPLRRKFLIVLQVVMTYSYFTDSKSKLGSLFIIIYGMSATNKPIHMHPKPDRELKIASSWIYMKSA